MPARHDLLDGIDRIYVDGSNLLPALTGSAEGPPAAILGRIRSTVPPEIRLEIVFDGPSGRSPAGRVATGMAVRYAGRRSADAMLIDLASTAGLAGHPPGSNVIVITDDRGLSSSLRKYGVRTIGTLWLIHRLERRMSAGPSVGQTRPPRPPAATGLGPGSPGATAPAPTQRDDPRDAEAAADARRWKPGRGATSKTGEAQKAPRSARSVEGRPWKRRRRPAG